MGSSTMFIVALILFFWVFPVAITVVTMLVVVKLRSPFNLLVVVFAYHFTSLRYLFGGIPLFLGAIFGAMWLVLVSRPARARDID